MVYLWMRMVRVTDPDEDTTISVEEAYVDAYVNDEMVSSADEGGLSDAPGTAIFNANCSTVLLLELGWIKILVQGFENVAGKLRQK